MMRKDLYLKIREYISFLDKEIKELEKQKRYYVLTQGEIVKKEGDKIIYKFRSESEIRTIDDTPMFNLVYNFYLNFSFSWKLN